MFRVNLRDEDFIFGTPGKTPHAFMLAQFRINETYFNEVRHLSDIVRVDEQNPTRSAERY
jgi:hypothetical protein